MQRVPTDPFTSQENFISVKSTDGPLRRQEKKCLAIRQGRICGGVEILSGCSSGPSTSSTVEGIAKISKGKNSGFDNNCELEEENCSFGEGEFVGRKSRLSDACGIKSKIEKNTIPVVMTGFFQFCKNKML
jgi:hypothetical protein